MFWDPMRQMRIKIEDCLMIKPDFSIEKIIKISLWVIFGGLAVTALFDFDDWASRASWCIKFLLLAFVLHLVVSWIYKD